MIIVLREDDLEEISGVENWGGYYFSMTYEIVSPESAEIGEFEETDFVTEKSENYLSLQDLLYNVRNHTWLEWSSTARDVNSWIVSEAEEDFRTGNHTSYCLWIHRVDGQQLSSEEYEYIDNVLCIK